MSSKSKQQKEAEKQARIVIKKRKQELVKHANPWIEETQSKVASALSMAVGDAVGQLSSGISDIAGEAQKMAGM